MKPIQNNVRRKTVEIILIVLILLFCECFFFRNVIFSNLNNLLGDRGDGRLTMLLTEHWWSFICGKEKFSEIAMFFPAEEVFGYTDLFLGYGIIHIIFRLLGMNMFLSYKWTLIVTHALGTASMYYLLSKKMKCDVFWSLFGTMAFCFSSTFAFHIMHTQLCAISYLPGLLILLIGFVENFRTRIKRNLYGYGFVVLFVLLTYTSWYIACFTGVFCLIGLIIFVLYALIIKLPIWEDIKANLFMVWKDIIGYLVVLILLFIPFISIYIPVMKSSSGYSYGVCRSYLPEIADLLNVTEKNWMLGWLIEKAELSTRGYSAEVAQGFSIVLLIIFAITFFVDLRDYKSLRKGNNYIDDDEKYLIHNKTIVSVLYATIIVCVLLTIRLSANGVSLWWFVYTFIPVTRSVRAVARFLLWLSFPIAAITAYVGTRYFKITSGRRILLAITVLLLLFASNINMDGVSSAWTYQDEWEFINNVEQPPKDVEVFYIVDSNYSGDPEYIYQLDAFEIATWFGIKTINGYSGQTPQGWNGIWNPCSESYENSVDNWIRYYGLKNVYLYDRAPNEWMSYEEYNKVDYVIY